MKFCFHRKNKGLIAKTPMKPADDLLFNTKSLKKRQNLTQIHLYIK